MPDRPPRADGAAHAPRSERAYRCVGIPTFRPCRVCAAASASATLQTRLTSDAGLRAYRWWLRRIATSLRGVEDAYLLGRGSLVCALVAVACLQAAPGGHHRHHHHVGKVPDMGLDRAHHRAAEKTDALRRANLAARSSRRCAGVVITAPLLY